MNAMESLSKSERNCLLVKPLNNLEENYLIIRYNSADILSKLEYAFTIRKLS